MSQPPKEDLVSLPRIAIQNIRRSHFYKPEPPLYNEVLLDNADYVFTEPHTFKERDSTSNIECVKTISVAKNQGQLVSVIEYSGTCSRKRKHEVAQHLFFPVRLFII